MNQFIITILFFVMSLLDYSKAYSFENCISIFSLNKRSALVLPFVRIKKDPIKYPLGQEINSQTENELKLSVNYLKNLIIWLNHTSHITFTQNEVWIITDYMKNLNLWFIKLNESNSSSEWVNNLKAEFNNLEKTLLKVDFYNFISKNRLKFNPSSKDQIKFDFSDELKDTIDAYSNQLIEIKNQFNELTNSTPINSLIGPMKLSQEDPIAFQIPFLVNLLSFLNLNSQMVETIRSSVKIAEYDVERIKIYLKQVSEFMDNQDFLSVATSLSKSDNSEFSSIGSSFITEIKKLRIFVSVFNGNNLTTVRAFPRR